MGFGIGLGLAARRTVSGGAGVPASGAPFTMVNPDGWTVTYPSPPAIDPAGAPVNVRLLRQGFGQDGAAVMREEALVLTKRLRRTYPDQAQLTPDQVALSDYVYASDEVAGATNGSAESSPKPVANWAMTDRIVVGDIVTLEVVAFHRNGRAGEQVACVEFRATDGATTVRQIMTGSQVSPRATDRNAVIVYRADLDIGALANPAVITCNARVIPWIGTAASILDSADQTAAREFSPRVFRRDTARAAAPPLAYVAAGGSDAAGAVSATAAVARGQPFATVLGAIKGLKAAAAVTGGRVDGCEVRLGAGSFAATSLALGDTTGGIQDHAALTITRDPSVSRANAILTFGAAPFRTRFPYLRLADITLSRTGIQSIQGETGQWMQVVLSDVVFDNANQAGVLASNAGVCVDGCDLRNATGSVLTPSATEIRLVRGLLNTTGVSVESWLVLGCRLTNGNHGSALLSNGTRSSNGAIIAFNHFSGYRIGYGGLAETISCAVVQNVVEFFSATSNTGLGMSADSNLSSTRHAVILHNTFAGFWNHGRSNLFYDETPGTERTHRLLAAKGNIHVSVNTKGDVFLQDSARTGNWPYLYGVGVAGELIQFDAASPGFRQEFQGLGTVRGLSTVTPVLPGFSAPAHTVSSTAGGAGGGTYTLIAGAAAKAVLSGTILRFDLAGGPRGTGQSSAGAHE